MGVFWQRGYKRRHQSKNVDKEEEKDYFYGKEVGYADEISGIIDDQNFHIHGMKETDYTMMLMTTYGTLERSGSEIKCRVNEETVQLKYPEIFLEPLDQPVYC